MIVMICDGEPSSCENVIEQRGFGFPGVPVKRVQGKGAYVLLYRRPNPPRLRVFILIDLYASYDYRDLPE